MHECPLKAVRERRRVAEHGRHVGVIDVTRVGALRHNGHADLLRGAIDFVAED